MKYRRHIDGLRAVAVLSVIFFHYDIQVVKGGFVGVDIFFVISGYLISSIIYTEVQQTASFNISRFYLRRLKRLAPSLIVTIALVYLVALGLFTSQQLASLGTEIVTGILSIANFLFWTQSGYFDTSTEQKPLLHLWSLSVEEQFYLVWPLVLLIAYRLCAAKGVVAASILTFFITLTLTITLTKSDAHWFTNQLEGIFYLTPFRAYEFMVGVLGVFLVIKMPSSKFFHELLFALGFVGIVFSINQFDSAILFPYYTALLPCFSALCLILSQRSGASKLLLENKFMVYIGLISYTLYLVHWPVIVFAKNLNFGELTNINIALSFTLTVMVSLAIYRYVETPLRQLGTSGGKMASSKVFVVSCSIAVIALLIVGVSLITSNGYQGLKTELYTDKAISEGKARRYSLSKNACRIENLNNSVCHSKRETQVLVYGNSHEPDGYNIVSQITQNNKSVNLILFGRTNHCVIEVDEPNSTIKSETKRNKCDLRVNALSDFEFIRSIDVLVFSSNRPFSSNKAINWKLFSLMQKINPKLKLVVLGTYFNTKLECAELSNRLGSPDACKEPRHITYEGSREQTSPHIQKLIIELSAIYLSKFRVLCNDRGGKYKGCLTEGYGEPMFYDQHHLSFGFSKLIAERYSEIYYSELESLKLL